MSHRDWFDEYEHDARRSGDGERLALGRLHREAYRFRETDPDQALALLAEGRRLAERLREPWWALYYDQQSVHALLHFKQDFREVIGLAVRNTLEVRKPAYAHFPRRLQIHGDLVSAYLGTDPLGHRGTIAEALAYLDREVSAEGDDRYLLLGSQRQFALDTGRLDDADSFSRRSLALAAEDPEPARARHFLVFTYAGLCEVAWRRGDLMGVGEASRVGEELARMVGHQMELAGFCLWQALALGQGGEQAQAAARYRQATTRLGRLRMPPDASYRDAECAFLGQTGRLDLALGVRDRELAAIRGRGRLAYECACQLKRCALRHQLGILTTADVEKARAAAGRLRAPAGPLAELHQIESGGGP